MHAQDMVHSLHSAGRLPVQGARSKQSRFGFGFGDDVLCVKLQHRVGERVRGLPPSWNGCVGTSTALRTLCSLRRRRSVGAYGGALRRIHLLVPHRLPLPGGAGGGGVGGVQHVGAESLWGLYVGRGMQPAEG